MDTGFHSVFVFILIVYSIIYYLVFYKRKTLSKNRKYVLSLGIVVLVKIIWLVYLDTSGKLSYDTVAGPTIDFYMNLIVYFLAIISGGGVFFFAINEEYFKKKVSKEIDNYIEEDKRYIRRFGLIRLYSKVINDKPETIEINLSEWETPSVFDNSDLKEIMRIIRYMDLTYDFIVDNEERLNNYYRDERSFDFDYYYSLIGSLRRNLEMMRLNSSLSEHLGKLLHQRFLNFVLRSLIVLFALLFAFVTVVEYNDDCLTYEILWKAFESCD